MTIRNRSHRFGASFLLPMYGLAFWVTIMFGQGCSSQTAQNAASPTVATTEQQLREAAGQWLNTPHKLGGLDRNGIDCSGLVMVLYRDLFNCHLPRTTRQQVRQGVTVDREQLMVGDLVFFRPPDKGGHVGIYLGKGEFVHATTRRGVMVSHLTQAYWRRSYWTARRVLPS